MNQANSKRRLCIIMGGHFSATIGGAQYQAKCIVEQLVKKNEFEIFYLTRAFDPTYTPVGYQIIKIGDAKGLSRYSFVFDGPRLKRLLNEIRPDVIYQRGLKAYTGVAARYALKNNSRFIFHIAHDYDVLPSKVRAISWRAGLELVEKRIGEYGLRKASAVVAQTQQQSELLFKNYGRKATLVIPNLHPEPENDICKKPQPIKVVWVANFKSMKQPEVFVRLAEDLSEKVDVEFVMIGRPGDPKLYSGLHQRLERLKNLRYLGELPIDEVNRILAKAHVFVNTSKAEGFPNTFIQAWMRKVPVVSLSVNTDGVLNDGKIGLFGGDYEGLKHAVESLIDDSERRLAMGERAQTYAFEHHSVKNIEKLMPLMSD